MSRRISLDDKIPLVEPCKPIVRVSILSEAIDYNHKLLNIPEMWKSSKGKGVKIAILDTGLPRHLDLEPTGGKNFTSSDTLDDFQMHSTHVGGIIAAKAFNGMGVRGISPDTETYYAKVLNDDGTGSVRSIIDAIYWAVDEIQVDIINMSLGMPHAMKPPVELEQACNYAVSKGVTLIAAAGNDAKQVNWPAAYSSVIAVGAVDENKNVANFSSRGSQIDFVAGGVNVYSTYGNTGYAKLSGTSMACPAISALAALIIADARTKNHSLLPNDVKNKIKKIAFDIGPEGKDEFTGYGIPVFVGKDSISNGSNEYNASSHTSTADNNIWSCLVNCISNMINKIRSIFKKM